MVKLIYILIKLTEVAVFIAVGKRLSNLKDDKKYWQTAMPAIITFALVDGLRYLRMGDYLGNLSLFTYLSSYFQEGIEPLYTFLMYSCKTAGIGLCGFLVIQSSILMIAIFMLLKRYRKYAVYSVPLILPLIILNEHFTRWFMAFSFIIISYVYMSEKKYLFAGLYMILAQMTHNAIVPFIPMIIIYPLLNKRIIPIPITVVLIIFTTLFSDISNFTLITQLSEILLNSGLIKEGSMANHLLHTDELISGEYLEIGMMSTALYVNIINLAKTIPIVIFSAAIAKKENAIYIYNIVAIGLIAHPLLSQVELLGRYTLCLNCFLFITAAMFYKSAISIKKRNSIKCWIALISLILYFYPTISIIFNRGTDIDMLFIWDAYSNIKYL